MPTEAALLEAIRDNIFAALDESEDDDHAQETLAAYEALLEDPERMRELLVELGGEETEEPESEPEPSPDRLSAEDWTRYEGTHGGRGWLNSKTGEVAYQHERPGGDTTHPDASKAGVAGLLKRAAAAAGNKAKALSATVLNELKPATIIERVAAAAHAVRHPAETIKRVKDKAVAKYKSLEERYGRTGAIAIAGAYAGYYVAFTVNPLATMAVVPSPSAVLLGSAEALRYAFSEVYGGKDLLRTTHMSLEANGDLLEEAKAFIAEMAAEAGEEPPVIDEDILVQVMAALMEGEGESEDSEGEDSEPDRLSTVRLALNSGEKYFDSPPGKGWEFVREGKYGGHIYRQKGGKKAAAKPQAASAGTSPTPSSNYRRPMPDSFLKTSAAVMPDGKPIQMYFGSRRPPGWPLALPEGEDNAEPGIYVTESSEIAGRYVGDAGEGGSVLSVVLNVRNPLDLTKPLDSGEAERLAAIYDQYPELAENAAKVRAVAGETDGFTLFDAVSGGGGGEGVTAAQYREALRSAMSEAGYDAIKHEDYDLPIKQPDGSERYATNWLVFDPAKIWAPPKSAPGTVSPSHVKTAHTVIKATAGSANLASLLAVRAALAAAGLTERGQQDAAINELRRQGKVSASGPEGRHGTTPEEQAAWMKEGDNALGYLSVRMSLETPLSIAESLRAKVRRLARKKYPERAATKPAHREQLSHEQKPGNGTLSKVKAAYLALTDKERDGLEVWYNAGPPERFVIDQMDWHEGEGGKKVIAIAELATGSEASESRDVIVKVQNEGGKPEAEGWVKLETDGSTERLSAAHAPAGGLVVAGEPFAGGEFIPGEVVAKASAEEKAKLKGGEKAPAPATPVKPAGKPKAVRVKMTAAKRVGTGADAKIVLANGKPAPEHITSGMVPPDWSEVHVSLDPKADVLVTARDSKGNPKTVYSDQWDDAAKGRKFARVYDMMRAGSEVRKQVQQGRFDPATKEHADCAFLIEQQGTRPGSDSDTKGLNHLLGVELTPRDLVTAKVEDEKTGELKDALFLRIKGQYVHVKDAGTAKQLGKAKAAGKLGDSDYWIKSFGATTLEARHVVETKEGVRLAFVGKEGVWHDHLVSDPKLAEMLLERKKAAGKDSRGRLFKTNERKLNEYISGLDGGGFTAKDFRTKKANEIAIKEVGKRQPPHTMKEYKKAVLEVGKVASGVLGNDAKMALASYINPAVFSGWFAGLPKEQ